MSSWKQFQHKPIVQNDFLYLFVISTSPKKLSVVLLPLKSSGLNLLENTRRLTRLFKLHVNVIFSDVPKKRWETCCLKILKTNRSCAIVWVNQFIHMLRKFLSFPSFLGFVECKFEERYIKKWKVSCREQFSSMRNHWRSARLYFDI